MTLKMRAGLATPVMRVTMNKEYWQAKADLCQATALKQLEGADAPAAIKNLERMVYALSRVEGFNEREGK